MPPAFVLSQDQTLQSKNLTAHKSCCFLNGKSDSFYCVTTVISASNEASLKPLTRAHRTIQHFSKNTPKHKTKMSSRRFPYSPQGVYVPRRFLICLVSGWFPATPHCRGPPDSLCPSHGTHQGPLQNRTALFNIASIFCLSMLFSKNSRRFLPDPFEKNTSQHPQHCPIPGTSLSRITPHSRFGLAESSG